ncbi:lytic transglycosylase domain-containing protein [Candidatus Magnetomonas plexicatena]|nr:lytic transglycosylase domain-containing protein [Nitrospirales bacterium LBB_01]
MSAYAYRDAMLASSNITKRQDFEQSYKPLEDPGTVNDTKPSDSRDTIDTVPQNSRVDKYDEMVKNASDKYGVDSALIKAVMRAESGGNSKAVSRAGARGLMQLMPATARDLGVKNSFNPKENIEGGTKYLRQLLDRYDGDVNQAVAAYNWGMGNVERRPTKMPTETKNYIAKVQSYYKNYSETAVTSSGTASAETS